ncbi:TPA: hypothetical protein ACH3X1_004429 [Trebouxia sp. C0004]
MGEAGISLAGMEYDGMCEDVVEDHLDLDSPRPQAPESWSQPNAINKFRRDLPSVS